MIIIINFKSIPDEEKPRERLALYGAEYLSNEELLMIVLRTGYRGKSVKELSIELLSFVGGIDKFRDMKLQNFLDVPGIGRVKAIELCALIELSRRIYNSVSLKDLISFHDSITIVNYFNEVFQGVKQEEFYCVFLDNKKKYIDKKKLFVGTINFSVVHPREIFKMAYLLSASFIICVHNHPSGDPTPSDEDIVLTKKLKELGELHAIYLVDHIIIGDSTYYSFYDDNMVLNTK